MRTLQTKLCRARTHTQEKKERKVRGDLSRVTLDRTEGEEEGEGEEGNKNMRGVTRQRLRLL